VNATKIVQAVWRAYGRAPHFIHFATAMYARRVETLRGARIVWRWL
jgi:hypothetical protein